MPAHAKATEIAQAGRKLLNNIDQRMDNVEEKSKQILREMRMRLKNEYKSMRDELAETANEDILEPLE